MGRYRQGAVSQVIPTKLTKPSLPLTETVPPHGPVCDAIAWVCLYPLQAKAQWVATTRGSRQERAKQLIKFTPLH
jgi:hypothetical protein